MLLLDIGNIYKRESLQCNIHNNHPVLQRRLSQATQARNTLARASSIKNIINSKYIYFLKWGSNL